ncbi:zinc finger protein [Macleaya cordata]|uniref:Zinc finger protein n=1 Tax=Macleaya cordata TaxID=56857 RepID=A0A200R594_MACCD|nr:zinc finger protein [Macleaya cordata]
MESEEIKSEDRARKRRKRDKHDEKVQRVEGDLESKKRVVEKRSRALVGRYVKKEFEGYGVFLGKVVSYSVGLYRVDYEDGDSEDLESNEISEILLEEGDFDPELITRRKRLDELISARDSKTASKRSANKSVLAANGLNETETSSISKLSSDIECGSGKDVEPEGLEEPVPDGDADSSSDSCEFVRVRHSENDAPLVPPPSLPASSGNINVPEESVSQLFSVYNFLRTFSIQLYLSPFQLDDLVGSLNYVGPNTLLDAIHFSLMRALRRHLEMLSSNGVELALKCLRRLDWSLLDTFTWPVYVVEYLLVMGYAKGSEWNGFYNDVLDKEYYRLSVSRKLVILQILCDDVLESAELRAEIDMRESSEVGTDSDGTASPRPEKGPKRVHPRYSKTSACKDPEAMDIITNSQEPKSAHQTSSLVTKVTELDTSAADVDEDGNSDECRLCGMDGTLLCCDGCPSAYHSRCIGVNKMLLPLGSWFCPECTANKKEPTLRIGTGLKGAEIFGVDTYEQVFLGTCNHLLVLKSSLDVKLFSRYYNQNDIPKVLRVLYSSGQYKTLYSGICKGILEYWGIPEDENLSLPERTEAVTNLGEGTRIPEDENLPLSERTEAVTNLGEGKEGAVVSVPSCTFSGKETDKLIEIERENCASSVVDNNIENGVLSCLENDCQEVGLNATSVDTMNQADLPALDRDDVTTSRQVCPLTDIKLHEQFGTESTISTGSINVLADPSNSTHQVLAERSDVMEFSTGASASGNRSGGLSMSSENTEGRHSDGGKSKGNGNDDCSYMGALFKPQNYINQYSLGDVAASAAASLAVIASEDNRVSKSQASSNPRKIISADISVQVKAFSLVATRFFWPNPEKKLTEVPRERCGWCLSCKTATTCKKGCLLNLAALNAIKGSVRILGALRPVKTGEGNLPGIATYIFYMEENLRGLVVGPFLSPNYRRQWRKQVEQASTCNALKPLLLELEENIRLVAFSKGWVKLVDDWLVESSGTQSGTCSVGPTPKRPGGRRNKKQSATSEIKTEPCDDDSKNFRWWRGGKLLKLVFQKGILPCPIVKKAARRGGSRKIPGVYYAEGSEIPKRSRRFAWRAAVEMSKNAAQLALQVRYLDLHVRWSDLTRPELTSQDSKGPESVISAFRNARIFDKKVQENKISYGLNFGNQKHLPSRVMKNILEVEQNPDGKDKFWFSETQIPLYLIKEFEENVEKVPLPSTKKASDSLSKFQRQQLKASRKDIFSYLMHKGEKVDKCFCASCQEDVLLGDAVKCNACQGYCHKNCTKSSTVSMKNEVEVRITCKKCFCAKAFALNESVKKQAISKICWQGQEYQVAVAAREGAQQNSYQQPLAYAGNIETQMVKKSRMPGPKLATKGKKVTVPNYGVIWKKKNSEETGAEFRLTNILLRGNAYLDPSRIPTCVLCSKPYNSDLMYISCGSCSRWYHADAIQLEESQIFDVVGFKCGRCRKAGSPICPHMDQDEALKARMTRVRRASKQGSTGTGPLSETICPTPTVLHTKLEDTDEGFKSGKTWMRASKQGSTGIGPSFETIHKQPEVLESTPTVLNTKLEEMMIEENDPLLFSLERVEPIIEIKSEVEPEWDAAGTLSSQGPQKLPVRRLVKCEKDANGSPMENFHSESIPLETNNFLGSERDFPQAEWEFPVDGLKDEMMFDLEGFNYEDMTDFEPQTYFSFTELLATDDDQLNPSDASMMNMSGDWGNTSFCGSMPPPENLPEQNEMGSVKDHQEIAVEVEPTNNVIPCHLCHHPEPAPDLFCEECSMCIHNHCSPWIEQPGEGRWRCGNCRVWQ